MGDYRPSHFGICVRDLDRSLEVAGPVRIVSQFIQNDTMKIELLHFIEPAVTGTPSATRNQVGMTHLSFSVDDLDAATKHLVDCGATLVEGTRANPGIDLLFLADPDGVRVELMALPA